MTLLSCLQDRDHAGGRTPRWRGITLLHELRAIETGIKTGRTDKPYAGLHWLVADVCGRKEPA